MKHVLAAVVLLSLLTSAWGQIFPGTFSSDAGLTDVNAVDARGLAHPAVVENALAESHLPPELLNPFYKNPAIAAGLAKESWFGHKEFPVYHREAEKIPRSEILKIVKRIEHRRRRR